MRGKVLSFNGSSGLISGDDGQRYSFNASDLMGGAVYVAAGSTVDFEVAGSAATSVYVIAQALGDKNKWVAAILAFPGFPMGMFGIHKFYLGKSTAGILMIVGTCLIVTAPIVAFIAFIETIIYLVKSDQSFYEDYVVGDRSWF